MLQNFLTVNGLAAITSDPKIIEASSGSHGLSLSLGVREFFMNRNGLPQSIATYIDAELWSLPEQIKNLNLKKGDQVEFKGKLNESSWEQKDTGEKRKKHFIKLKTIKKFEE